MASPSRFPRGLVTFPARHVLSTFPISTSPSQIVVNEDFLPYRAGDYTVTNTNGTAATFAWPSGALKLSTTGSTAADAIWLQRGGAAFCAINGNQFWLNFRVAYPRSVGNANDTNIYLGLFDNAVPTSASNGIYFIKPTGGTSVNFVIKKGGTATTFQKVADLALPSGLYGDANAVNGVLNTVVAGNAVTGVSVATPGAGYQTAPLILSTSTSGAAGLVPVFAQLASSAVTQGNPQLPIVTTGLPYSSLGAPVVINAAAGSFTNTAGATTYLEAEPLIDLSIFFDGKGLLSVGVNGRQVMSIRGDATSTGVYGVAAGATVDNTSVGPTYYSTTQLSTSISPSQPPIGSPINLMPLLPMTAGFGFVNTTANARAFYLAEYSAAVELN